MSKIIKSIIPNSTIIGNVHPPRSGAFEVTINEKNVYSKFTTGTFPKEKEVKNWFI